MIKPYYERGGIVIFNCDCRDILRQLEASVIITDPPYNCRVNYGPATNANMPWPDWCRWWDECLEQMAWAAPDILSFLSQTAWRKYVQMGRHEIDWTLVWNKPLSLAVCAMPFMPHWEPIAYWGITRKAAGAFWGGDVLSCNVSTNHHGHPTEKPLKLMLDLVRRFDGVILDPFAGSGTTLLAAQILGKPCIGVEINEEYCEIIVKRLESDAPLLRFQNRQEAMAIA